MPPSNSRSKGAYSWNHLNANTDISANNNTICDTANVDHGNQHINYTYSTGILCGHPTVSRQPTLTTIAKKIE